MNDDEASIRDSIRFVRVSYAERRELLEVGYSK